MIGQGKGTLGFFIGSAGVAQSGVNVCKLFYCAGFPQRRLIFFLAAAGIRRGRRGGIPPVSGHGG
jgi:hypothetical protein